MKKRILTILLAFIVSIGFVVTLPEQIYALDSTGNATFDAFINDARFTSGVSWGNGQRPKLSSFSSSACCAYCADFTKYCFGIDNPRGGTSYSNAADTRAGDVVHLNTRDNSGHWIAVLARSGNSLYVAEGNASSKVRIGWGNYSVNGSTINGLSFSGWHFGTPGGSPNPSGAPEVNVGSGEFVIHSAIDDNYCLDIEGDSKENNANIQLYKVLNNNVQKFRISKWYGSYSCISSVYSGHWLDVKTPIGDNSNVKLYYTNAAEENDWAFEDAGNGYVYIRNKTGYYLDVQGDQAVNYANIQLYHFVGNNSQKWRLEDVTKYKNELPSVSVIHSALNDGFCLDIEGDSKENNANIQLYKVLNNNVQKFRISKWYGNYTCISSVYSGHWLDVKTPIDSGSNVKLYYTNAAEENDWAFEDAGNGYVYIRNKTGYYLDVQGSSAVNYANIQLYHFLGDNSQKWRLEDVTVYSNVAPGTYEIHSAWDDNFCLDIAGDSKENNANIQLYKKINSDVQRFQVIRNTSSNGYSWIKSVYSGHWLDVKTPIDSGSNVKLYYTNAAEENNWIFEDAGDGYVYIKNKTGYYLDLQGDNAVNHANIQIYHFVNNNSQRWKLVHAHTLGRTESKPATIYKEGSIEYWTCSGCGKYFKDSAGKNEITKAQTIIPKLTPSNPTGSNSSSTHNGTTNPTTQNTASELTATLTVNAKILKPKAAKGAVTVKWKKLARKKQKKISGYQIQIATDKNFENIVKTAKAGKKASSKKVKGLARKTTYYVRVRTYKGSEIGTWSVAKKFKTK